MKKSIFLTKYFAPSDRLILSPNEKETALRLILISFIDETDTQTNITRKNRKNYYNKYTVHPCSGNIGITSCTTATITKTLQDFSPSV
jgi:hypothetical protein